MASLSLGCYPYSELLQNVSSWSELNNLLGSDLNGLASSRVVTFSCRTGGSGESAEANEGNFSTFLEFSFSNSEGFIKSFLSVNFGHASFCCDGIN